MKMMIRMKVCVSLLMFLWILTVSRGDTEVSCVLMERCILPCSFQVGPQVVIHWIHLKGLHVHTYYNNQDQLEHQHQLYRKRTSLFKDQISRGNASLQLTGVKVQDEGRYECYTSTIYRYKNSFINLKVDAPVHEVHIQQVENRITCSSVGQWSSVSVGGAIAAVVGAVLVGTAAVGLLVFSTKLKAVAATAVVVGVGLLLFF